MLNLTCLSFSLLFALPVLAQVGGGSVVGYVADPADAVIAGAQVIARNLDRNVPTETTTNQLGYFEFPLLPAGRYRLEASKQGFQRSISAEFALNTGTRPRIDLKLVIGQVSESISVEATAPLVNATTTDLGVVMDRSKVDSLPLNGRDWRQLVGLQAGVVASPASSGGGRGGIEFHGSSSLGNNLLMDGVDMSFGEVNGSANDSSAGVSGGSLINTVSVEAVEEFKATGSAFSAEFGRSSGGVLNITTKSGTNQLHGTLFEFFRNEALDANSFFNNRNNLRKPPLRWNQFGGNLGGPLVKDRLFFFFNYEGAVATRAQNFVVNTPSPALIAQLPAALRQTISALSPPVTNPTSNPLIGQHIRNDSQRNNEHTYMSRSDAVLGSHRIAMRYSYNHQDYSQPLAEPSLRRLFPNRFHNAVLQDTWTIGASLFNEFRFGVNRADLFRSEPGREKFPAWWSSNEGGIGSALPSYIGFMTNTYTVANNLTMIRGTHTLKTGFEVRLVRSARDQGGQPTHIYNTLADMIGDRPLRVQVLFGGPKKLSTENYGFYFQDDWRLSRRLQLNLGARYEYNPPFVGGFNVNTSDPFGSFNAAGTPMFKADRNNLAPRAGLVFDVLGNQKLVLRSGGGVGYLPPQPIFLYDAAFIDPRLPFVTNFAPADVPPGTSSYPFPQSFVAAVVKNPSLLPANFVLARAVADYNRRDTYAGQWNFSVQYGVTKALAVQAAYVGSRSVNLPSPRTLNLVDPRLGRRPRTDLGDVQYIEHIGRLSYHGLQLSVNQRMWHGLTFDAYYTWSKGMAYGGADTSLGFTEGTVQDPLNIAGSYGPRQGDTTHRATGVISYAIPSGRFKQNALGKTLLSGWSLQAIAGKRSGVALNLDAGRDNARNGRAAGQRPDAVPGVSPYVRNTNTLVWITPTAFDNASPLAQSRFGNLGFNTLRGPGAVTLDGALHKSFFLTERHRLTFRFELFNAMNHVVLGNPVLSLTNPNFGRIQSGSGGRNVQFALKYQF